MLSLIIPNPANASAAGANIQDSRFVQPNKKRFTVPRIVGSSDLWASEFVLIMTVYHHTR
jgi:hypothetical protein